MLYLRIMRDYYSAPEVRELPPPPSWRKAVGVGIIIMGMAMGTGELIMWPHLVTKFGLGLLWLAVVGITLQYFINQEVIRHTIATGESFFTTSGRAVWWSPLFWLPAAVLLYIWPGWASVLGTILATLFGFGTYVHWAWISLALVLLLTFLGRSAYAMLETALKVIVPVFIALLVVISAANLRGDDIMAALRGIANVGYLPEGIDMSVLLGAIVFAGAGGMLNLVTSLWYRDKQAGMAHYEGRIQNPVSGKPETLGVIGSHFQATEENLSRWRGWMRYVRFDQGIIFWLIGLVTLVLLAVNAFVVLRPLGLVPEGTKVAIVQAEIFSSQWGQTGAVIYLVMTYLMLFSVMWTVIDALTRIVTDIVHTNSREGRLRPLFGWLKPISVHHLYYSVIVIVVAIQAALLPYNQPLGFLVTSSVLGGVTMAIYTPLLLYVNNRRLPKGVRPGIVTNLFLVGASAFYIYFAAMIIAKNFLP